MAETTEEMRRFVREMYDKACSAYVAELALMWELDCKEYGYWTGSEVGGAYNYGDSFSIIMADIIYCVDNDVTMEEYLEYEDYWMKCKEYSFEPISLKAWHEGAPRISEQAFDRLDGLKRQIDEEISEIKKMY